MKKNGLPFRCGVVCPNYGLVGGAERFVFELTERLAEREYFEMHVFANKWRAGGDNVIFHKVPMIRFPRWARPVSFAIFVQKAIKSGKFDIVHSHERLFGYDFLTHHGLPHKTWVQVIRNKRLSLFDRATARIEEMGINSADLPVIMPVSTIGKNELLKLFDIPESRIQMIHPGITLKKFAELDKEKCRQEVRMYLGLSLDDVVLLFVGMNFETKGLERILKGVSVFTEGGSKYSELKLLVVGKGNRRKYLSMARSLKIDDRIIFAGTIHDVEKHFLASDLVVLMSYLEPFGIVILEAMAAGLPVIISDTVGARDVVESGVTGYIVNGESLEREMAGSLSVLMDQERRRKMGENAKRKAAGHDWDIVAEQVAGLYMRRVVDKRELFS